MNLPLLGTIHVAPVPAGAPAATLLLADQPQEMKPVIDLLGQTRKSLTLRSLFVTGFPHDPEFFAAGLALARQWSRQGLRIAVVDLDYRHPTVVRPRPEPNEGLVDSLEYGCSFQRIAWELVSEALWLVGPGSHPPDEQRFSEHPDWDRVMRIFSGRVDLVIYLAPFLDRKGLSGALSKRMDGVVLAACVRRSTRAALRDAFLELWGSDAPMIGCFGIDAPAAPAPAAPKHEDWGFPSHEAPYTGPDRRAAPRDEPPAPPKPAPAPAMPRRDTAPSRRVAGEAASQTLVAKLNDEVRRGHVTRSSPLRGRGLLLLALALALAGAGALATYLALRHTSARASAPAETLPAGTEPVLPADLGTGASNVPEAAPPAAGTGTATATGEGGTLGGSLTSGNSLAEQIAGGEDAKKPAPPSGRSYQVHVASFDTEKAAKLQVRRLHDRGLDAWYGKATDQPHWYRVFVGHYATHEEAVRQARSLLQRGLVEHAIAFPDQAR